MITVSITVLKANLSRYIREVRKSGEIEVLHRGTPIASGFEILGFFGWTEQSNTKPFFQILHSHFNACDGQNHIGNYIVLPCDAKVSFSDLPISLLPGDALLMFA